jgi:hypothetical protein
VILGLVIVLCFEDEEGWENLPYSVDSGNQRYLLTVARLDLQWSKTPLRRYYHSDRSSNTYLEASLVKVVGILV